MAGFGPRDWRYLRSDIYRWWSLPAHVAFAKQYHGRRAGRPGRQHIRSWYELDDKGRQQQHVKSDGPRNDQHPNNIQPFIHESPTERPQSKLQPVNHQGDGQGKPNPGASQGGSRELSQKLFYKHHAADEVQSLTVRQYPKLPPNATPRAATGAVKSVGHHGNFTASQCFESRRL